MCKSIYKSGMCDYCSEENVIVRPSPFMGDIGADMCKICWDATAEEYAGSEGAYIGKFEDGTGWNEFAKRVGFNWIEIKIPKLKGRRRKPIKYTENEKVLVYKGYGILRTANTYNVTIIDGEKAGYSIARCENVRYAWMVIEILDKFYKDTHELFAKGGENNIKNASSNVMAAREAVEAMTGRFII